jgi:hypothetical protein
MRRASSTSRLYFLLPLATILLGIVVVSPEIADDVRRSWGGGAAEIGKFTHQVVDHCNQLWVVAR